MLINLAAFVVIVAGIIAAKPLLVPFLLAVFLAVICIPPMYWLKDRGIPVLVSVLCIAVLLILTETLIAGLIGSSLSEFSRALPFYQQRLTQLLQQLILWFERFGLDLRDQLILDQFNPGKIMGIVAVMLNNLLSILTNTFIILIVFLFILLEAAGIPTKIRAMSEDRDTDMDRFRDITRGINRYLALKTLTSLITGVLIALGLKVIGVDFALMWAVLAFALNFIPTIGSILAAVPPVLLALVQLGVSPALTTATLFLVVNVIIGNLLEPRIMGSGVGLSTLVIFVSMTFWGWVLGPVGMLLSVPLTMTLKIGLSGSERTRGLAILLGSNAEARKILAESRTPPRQDAQKPPLN